MSCPKSVEEAFFYITECTLATVSDLALKKKRPKGEYIRQISMAQKCIDAIRNNSHKFTSPSKCSRIVKVINDFDFNVTKYAEKYEI